MILDGSLGGGKNIFFLFFNEVCILIIILKEQFYI